MTKYVEWWCEMHGEGTKTRTFQPALLAPLIDVGRRDGELVVSLSIWLALVFVVAALVLVLMIWSSKRRQNPRVDIGGALPFHELITSLSALTYGGMKEGNRIELLQKRWTLEEWKKRRLLHRLTDFGAYAINEQL